MPKRRPAKRNAPQNGIVYIAAKEGRPARAFQASEQEKSTMLDAATLREDLAAIEKEIRVNPNDSNLVKRYLTYVRKVREIEYRENGYVTARDRVSDN